MDKDYWLTRWARLETGFHQDGVNPYLLSFWPQLSLQLGDTVLVPLCGRSRDLFWLWQQGYQVIGVELSELAAEMFFSEHQLPRTISQQEKFVVYQTEGLQIWCGDFFELEPAMLPPIAAVYDRAALVALPPELRFDYASSLLKLIPKVTPILLINLDYSPSEMSGPPFAVPADELTLLFDPRACHLLAEFDVLADNPKFQQRGLSALKETVWKISGY